MTQSGSVLPSVDLTSCDQEPIHAPGAIQDFGALLICVVPDLRIAHASENAGGYLEAVNDSVVGSRLATFLAAATYEDVKAGLARTLDSGGVEPVFGRLANSERDIVLFVHVEDGQAIIDLELAPQGQSVPAVSLSSLSKAMNDLREVDGVEPMLNACAYRIKEMTDYDRVMIYRFLEDGSGQVVAEAVNKDLTPFLHLRYPASDIPKQARELYRKQLVRIVCNVDYKQIPLQPAASTDGRPLNIGRSVLRSVSPIHLEYLRNMRVRATLTVSLIVAGELWGLIACHHSTPKYVSPDMRTALDVFGQFVSLQIDAKSKEEVLAYNQAARTHVDGLIAMFSPESNIYSTLVEQEDRLRKIVNCDGLAVWADDNLQVIGQTPSEKTIGAVVEFMNRTQPGVFATDRLPERIDMETADKEVAAGMLALPISRSPRDYVMFFRQEIVSTVLWGGDPSKPAGSGANAPRLSPRKSFEAWRETVRFTSNQWSAAELFYR